MKTKYANRRGYGFTLIELLVVITIIAILTGVSMSAYNVAVNSARNLEARSMAVQIVLAAQNYHTEYGRLPVSSSNSGDSTVILDGSNSLLDVLLGQNANQLNPGRKQFIEPKVANSGANGLIANGSSYGLTDPWGQPFVVILDTSDDNQIANPDADNDDVGIARSAPTSLPRQIAVFSWGRDKRPNTADDVVSWR